MILHASDAVQEGTARLCFVQSTPMSLFWQQHSPEFFRSSRYNKEKSGLQWVLALIFVTQLHMRYQTTWGWECPKFYQYFMPLQGAILCLASPRGKKTAFTVWKNFPAVTDTILQLVATPTSPISEACMERLERFVILMFDRTSNKTSVNETRKQCLHRKVEHMMLSHQPGRPCYSTQTELPIKLVTVGAKHLHQAQIYLHQGIGDGFSQRENGSFSGRRFQM